MKMKNEKLLSITIDSKICTRASTTQIENMLGK